MKKIVTIGLSPCWDVVCRGIGLDWGDHSIVSQQRFVAGKAFNVSRALAWMGIPNTAAGLWGEDDFAAMTSAVKPLADLIDVRFTPASGETRQNITIIDTAARREMHLRSPSPLACSESLANLKNDLAKIITPKTICVFAGSMPSGELMADVIEVIESLQKAGAKIVLDTSGGPLGRITEFGRLEIIKPNLDELSQLTGVKIDNSIDAITDAAKKLLDRSKTVIVTRGKEGAVVVTPDRTISGRCITQKDVISTVGCGDFFLAGFLAGDSPETSLTKALKASAARAWAQSEKTGWNELENKIEVEIS